VRIESAVNSAREVILRIRILGIRIVATRIVATLWKLAYRSAG
jgi:hypothetical protein